MRSRAYASGLSQGRAARQSIAHNLERFVTGLACLGCPGRRLRDRALAAASELPEGVRAQIAGLAEGAGQPLSSLLAYNLYREAVFADGCTVMAALGTASAAGRTLLMKNSDQLGNESMVGANFHEHKDIYVVQVTEADNGRRIVGLSAAGAAGIKVGVSDAGVAAASNLARTAQLAERKTDVSRIRARDRTQLLREGLEEGSALAAAQRILARTMAEPTSTPGNVEFADARECWVLETSYEHFANAVVRNGVLARTNRFQVLQALNDPADASSASRYERCSSLLAEAERGGGVTFEQMVEFSADHDGGRNLNSICRHSDDYRDETSLGAGVVEINPDRPGSSRIALALGKPCRAWRSEENRIELTADARIDDVPTSFLDGSAFRASYGET